MNNLDSSTVGGKIKYYRLLNGLLQEDLCFKSGLNRTTIIRYENDQVIHSLEICNKIAEALEIDPFLLYDEYLAFIASDYGLKIRRFRNKNNLTQIDLGQALGVHKKTISRWEKEKIYPTRENYLIFKEYIKGSNK
ncbi:helix-turn-helix domain-containing protein [Anaerovirgula multivorans]|uniref:helix-turn-helix domain-containing protein n=1 Tax=Anaerovirgula multivorans TaxID=312168 RepID=UPI00112FDB41|nr:helix-turn-helix transcriptional regulator [Anaerovirgula multivorans]